MAEETAPGRPLPPTYLEVTCKSSGNTRRFASGIDAGSAVYLINRKLKPKSPRALHIESVKEGEEPIAFGPNSVLVNYGDGWKLQTFTEADEVMIEHNSMPAPVSGGVPPRRKVSNPISFLYLVKIVFAFILIFVLGAILTLALENLPALILFVKSSI